MQDVLTGESYVIGFDDGTMERVADDVVPEEPVAGAEYYLRLVFRNDDAAYYQFALFPNTGRDYIVSAARKRTGDSQYIRLELTEARFLKTFIQECVVIRIL